MAGVYRRHRVVLSAILIVVWSAIVPAANVHTEPEKGSDHSSDHREYLTFGFFPMESPIALFKRFAPLRDYLAMQIQREIRLETAKNFRQFSKRTSLRQYDIVFTAPHMALHALDEDNYELAATFTKPLQSVFVVRAESPIQNVKELEGAMIATPPARAIVTIVGMKYLESQGLKAVRYKTYRTHNAAYSSVLGGETDAAMIANFIAMKAISDNEALKIVAQSETFPGVGILVAKDLPEPLKQDIKNALWSMKELPHGRTILTTIAQPGYVEADKQEFEVLRPFLQAAAP